MSFPLRERLLRAGLLTSIAALAAQPGAAPLRSEDVRVGNEPWVLGGTLAIPAGEGRFPAVVLVHGSGPNDRDESIGANKPFRDLAEGLGARGIAVLRYDKRTFQYRTQIGSSISIDDEVVVDAVAAVSLLRSRPEIDAQRIFVVGHSLGAQLAPEIALRAAPVAGAILLAPPARAPWDILLAQLRYLETPPEQLARVEQAVAELKAGTLEGSLLGAPAAYWQDWASRDGIATARKLDEPILVLRGERDYQVVEEDFRAWQAGLAGHAGAELHTLPGDNHLFIRGTGKPGPAEYATPGRVDDAVLDRIASFIARAR